MSYPVGTWRAHAYVKDNEGRPISVLALGYGKTQREARVEAAESAGYYLRSKDQHALAIWVQRDIEDGKTKLTGGYRLAVKRIEVDDWDAEEGKVK